MTDRKVIISENEAKEILREWAKRNLSSVIDTGNFITVEIENYGSGVSFKESNALSTRVNEKAEKK